MTPKTRLRLLLGLNICAVLVVMAVHYSHTIHRIVPDPDALADKDTIAYCKEVKSALAAGQYDRLETEARTLAASNERFRGAVDKIEIFYDALAEPGCNGFECRANERPTIGHLQDWLNRNPHQPTARIAMALAWSDHAWAARDCAEVKAVTFDGWQRFSDRMRVARSYLQGIDARADPEFWLLRLYVMRDSGATRQQIDALFVRAHEAVPHSIALVRLYAWILDPGWYGKEGDLGWLAETVLNDPGGEDGLIEYTTVAAAEALRIPYPHIYLETGLSWPRTKAGLALIQQRYGATNYQWNLYAYMALEALDRPAALDAYRHFAPQWNPDVWGSADYFYDEVLPWITWGQ